MTLQTHRAEVQGTFDDLGTALHEVTFVVVDLETTGGSADSDAITEVGAVKVRGGQVLGEFQTLVDPRRSIPPVVCALTGITDSMVASAPRLESVLPAFLEFARDTVLVAHNARFDMGFLRAACAQLGLVWPHPLVLDTVHLARQVFRQGEVRNHKLSTLAAAVGATTVPDHRALHDARATVDVLHAVIARVGGLGIHTVEELASLTHRVPEAQRRKRVLAAGLPHAPGVYSFRDRNGQVLYVGTSRDIATRVRSYFTAAERRTRVAQMLVLAESVIPIVCATDLEARVREVRLITEHQPPYNRRSRRQHSHWVKLTDEPFPRLSVVRQVRADQATYAGPFPNSQAATAAVSALHDLVRLRQCGQRLPIHPHGSPCALAELGKCGAPCDGSQTRSDYDHIVAQARTLLLHDSRTVVEETTSALAALAGSERFEDAASVRDRAAILIRGLARSQRIRPLSESAEIVAARRRPNGGWELACIRYGRLAASQTVERGVDPMPHIDAMVETAETVRPGPSPAPAAEIEEAEIVLRWLESPGIRIVRLSGSWDSPVHGAAAALATFTVQREPARF